MAFWMLLRNNLNHCETSNWHRQYGTAHARCMAATQISSDWKVVFICMHCLRKPSCMSSENEVSCLRAGKCDGSIGVAQGVLRNFQMRYCCNSLFFNRDNEQGNHAENRASVKSKLCTELIPQQTSQRTGNQHGDTAHQIEKSKCGAA